MSLEERITRLEDMFYELLVENSNLNWMPPKSRELIDCFIEQIEGEKVTEASSTTYIDVRNGQHFVVAAHNGFGETVLIPYPVPKENPYESSVVVNSKVFAEYYKKYKK